MLNLIILGAPGAGKGTQAENLAKVYNIPQISTGAILRKAVADKTPLGLQVEKLMSTGDLVPDDIVCEIVSERIKEADCVNGFILDGFPRNLAQAETLDKLLAKENMAITKVLSIEVSDDRIVNRMSGRRLCEKCGKSYHTEYLKPSKEGVCDDCNGNLYRRKDDEPEVVSDRLKVYHEKTAPLVEYYSSRGNLVVVEGQEKVEDTTALVLKAIEA